MQDAFPYWDTLIKASVCGNFRYITQDELLLPTTSVPGVPSMPTNSNVLAMPSGSNRNNYITPSLTSMPPLQMPLMPPPPPPPPRQSLFTSREQNVNMRTTMLHPNMPTSFGWQSPRPQRPITDINQADNQTNLPNISTQIDTSQQLSPSILSQSFQRDSSSSAPIQNINQGTIPKSKQTPQYTKQSVSRPVNQSVDETRDRSESVGRQDSRVRPRNVNNRGRSRSVKPRDNSTTSAAKGQQKKQNDKQTRPVNQSVDETRDRSESVGRQDSRGRPRNVNNRGRSRSVKPRDNSTTSAAKGQQKKQNDKQTLSSSSTNEQINNQNKV